MNGTAEEEPVLSADAGSAECGGARRLRLAIAFSTCLVFVTGAGLAGYYVWRSGDERDIGLPPIQLAGLDHQIARAIEKARAAVRESPSNAAPWGKLGMLLFVHDLSEAALPCLARAEQLAPEEPRWPYFQHLLLRTEKPGAALAKLRRTVALCGGTPETPRLRLGEALLLQGLAKEAEEQFSESLRHNPRNARGYLGLGRALSSSRPEEALAHLARAMEDVRARKQALHLSAAVHRQLGQGDVAKQEYRRAAALPNAPGWPDEFWQEALRMRVGLQATLDHVVALSGRHQLPEAVKVLRKLVKEYPDSEIAWLNLGRVLLAQKDFRGAEEALRTGLRATPEALELHFTLGLALLDQGNHQGAANCFRKTTELRPSYAVAHLNLGLCLADCGDQTGAIAALRKAIDCNLKPSQLVTAHGWLAILLNRAGDTDASRLHADKAIELRSQSKLLEPKGN